MTELFEQRRRRLLKLNALRRSLQDDPQPPPAPAWECPQCKAEHTKKALAENHMVCPNCAHHMSIGAYARLFLLLDSGSFRELDAPRATEPNDPLQFPDYADKVRKLRNDTGLHDAIITAVGKIDGHKTVIAAMDSRFMMGSMGTALGERFTRAVEYATKQKLPLIAFTASGGARMQEGIYSLMQMAKTSAAIERFSRAGGLFIVIYTHPTTGGVSASFAALGDIALAEPKALIGFAGPRVIEQTIGESLPEGFQRAEFQQTHGFVDQIVDRRNMKETLSTLLTLHGKAGGA